MDRRGWFLSWLGLDAGLALAVATSGLVLPELVAVLLVPILAALVRAHQGHHQFRRRGIEVTPGRQVLFGCSLVSLLLFEGLSGILLFDRAAPTSVWLTALTFYLIYLCLIALAVRPRGCAED